MSSLQKHYTITEQVNTYTKEFLCALLNMKQQKISRTAQPAFGTCQIYLPNFPQSTFSTSQSQGLAQSHLSD